MDIGERMRLARKDRKLSQRQLAQKSNITNGMISLIEQNRASPTVASLTKILDALDMSLADFFAPSISDVQNYTFPESNQLTIRPLTDQEQDEASHNISYRVIGEPRAPIEVLHEIYEPNANDAQEVYAHKGFEAGMVIEGEIELTLDGKVTILKAGDGFSFPSTLPHRFRNISKNRARIVSAARM